MVTLILEVKVDIKVLLKKIRDMVEIDRIIMPMKWVINTDKIFLLLIL